MKAGKAIRLAVGPEGGWTNAEVESFRTAQWRAASLERTSCARDGGHRGACRGISELT